MGFAEQGINRFGVRRGKRQRCGNPMAKQLGYKKGRCLGVVFGCSKAFFMGKGVILKPRQQAIGGRANHVQLRIMNVHVHKTRGNHAAGQMFDGQVRVACRQGLVAAQGLHDLATGFIGSHHKQTILLQHGLAARKIQQRSAKGFHMASLQQRRGAHIQPAG